MTRAQKRLIFLKCKDNTLDSIKIDRKGLIGVHIVSKLLFSGYRA